MSRLRLSTLKYMVEIYYTLEGSTKIKTMVNVRMSYIHAVRSSGFYEGNTWIPPHKIERIVFRGESEV